MLGFRTWEDCLNQQDILPFSADFKKLFIDELILSRVALNNHDLYFFTEKLPYSEHWRILTDYYEEATFFDIETTGLSYGESFITVISAYRQGEFYQFFKGENLADFLDLVDQSRLLVSFNGNSFDIPFIEHAFHIPRINAPYIDLRWIAYHHGFKGGLKEIEKQFDIIRPEEIRNFDGYDAIILYYRYTTGDLSAKELLIKYCRADVLALHQIAGQLLHHFHSRF